MSEDIKRELKMLGRNDLDHEHVVRKAADRIAELEAEVAEYKKRQDYLEIPLFLRDPATVESDVRKEFDRLKLKIAKQDLWIKIAGGISCPNCDNSGFTIVPIMPDIDPGEQCQFCYECPDSVFNRSPENEDG